MRIFDPKDQLGNSLLSQADTQKSSVKLEKQMAVGGGAITLTSTDISDIENWELSNASLLVEGQTYSFLPDISRDADGNLVIDFGTEFTKATLVLKRAVFGGVITIEVKIQQLMTKTLIDSKKSDYDASANIAQWKALGVEAKTTEPDNYPYADCSNMAKLTAADFDFTTTTIGKDVCLISFDSFNTSPTGTRTFPNVQNFEADLPSLVDGSYAFGSIISSYPRIQSFTGKIPNVQFATGMFMGCTHLTEWTVDLPFGLSNASQMFSGCTGLTEWTVELPSVLTDASQMFSGCTSLTEWTVDLPSVLTNANGMFMGCTGLTEWTVDLPSELSNAANMFAGCKLNRNSVQTIADSIPTVSGTHKISIGVDSKQITQAQQNAFNTTIVNKGWTVTWQRK